MRVLIATDSTADQRKTLAAVRALGASGADVTVGNDRFPCGPERSRYCRRRLRYPSPSLEPEAFKETLLRTASAQEHDVYLPLSDYTTIAAVALGERLAAGVGTALPPAPAFEVALDKLATHDAARSVGVETPRTWCVERAADLSRITREVRFPCVFKLRRGAGAVGLEFPDSPEALRRHYDNRMGHSDALYDAERPLVQELVPGPVHDACLLFDRGRMVAGYTQLRLAMLPSRGGVGIHNRSTDEPRLLAQARELLESLQWHGPAMVEFRRDDRDGRFRLLEINPRFWGTLDLAIHAGVDFPGLTCRLALGEHPESRRDYRVGLEYRWLLTHAPGYGRERGWRALWSLLRPGPRRLSELRWSDPLPHLGARFG